MHKLFISALFSSALIGCNQQQTATESVTAATDASKTYLIFNVDEQCEKLISKPIKLIGSDAQTLLNAQLVDVMPVMQKAGIGVTEVKLSQNGAEATLDFLTTTGDGLRKMESLSSCERLAYLDTIVSVLKENPHLNIKNVSIKQNGQALTF